MGMHIGLIAAKTPAQRLREAFSNTWPEFEVVATGDNFATPEEVRTWISSHEQFVSAADWTRDNPGRTAFVLWQDGPWAVLMDSSYTLASDEEKLKVLSSQLGTVMSFVVETAGGCAFFWSCENGQLRRKIGNSDGDVTNEGEPLAEEAGIDTNHYYMSETEALWKAFGLSSLDGIPRLEGCQAVCVVDHTDYGSLEQNETLRSSKTKAGAAVQPAQHPVTKKPWWKFW
jgi:hypothetical protein